MPIIPRYEIPDRDVPTARYPVAPIDETIPNALATVSKAALEIAGAQATLQAKRQRVEDATELAKRVVMAESDLDQVLDSIRGNRETHKAAPDEYTAAVQKLSEKWSKDLRPDLGASLTRTVTPRIIAGLRTAREIRNKYLADDARATLNATETAVVDRAGRLDQTDEQAFSRMYTVAEHMEGGLTEAGEPIPAGRQFVLDGAFPAYVRSLVDSNLLSATEGEKEIRETLDAMAYRRLQRMAISDNPGIVQRAIDVLKQEEDQKGSTFASVLSTEHRNALVQAAQGQRDHLRRQANEDEDRARRISDDRAKRLATEEKARDDSETTLLALGILRGERGQADLARVMLYNPTLRQDPTKAEHLYNLIESRGRTGGTTNWTLYNRVWSEVQQTRGAVNVVDRVLPYVGKVNGIAREDAEKLITMGRTAAESSIFKDDFFQAGQRDIDRALQPPVGVVDQDRWRRYAEASREFFDRAAPLVTAGQREKIPQLAREIGDRYVSQARRTAPVPRTDIPRYPDIEATVSGFIAVYGLPETWTSATTQEFNRQIRMHERLGTGAIEETAGAAKRTEPSRPSSKLPNPIQ